MSGRRTGMKWLLGVMLLLAQPVGAQEVRYIHTDALGSVVAVTDANRNVIERREYEPYGYQLSPVVQDGPGYTGHVQDAMTGLVYMQERYYDPTIARFISADPDPVKTDTAWNFNRYAYAANNPYKYVDPDGRAVRCTDTTCTAEGDSIAEAAIDALTIAIIYASRALENVFNESAETPATDDGGESVSDREPGPDGKRGSTGGPGAGRRFPQESPEVRADKEGVPCRYCGVPTTNEPGRSNSRERDHIDPRSRGGNNSSENEGDACRTCNRSKGARNPDEWQPER